MSKYVHKTIATPGKYKNTWKKIQKYISMDKNRKIVEKERFQRRNVLHWKNVVTITI